LHLAWVFLPVQDFFHIAAVFFLPPQEDRHGPREGGEGGGEASGGGAGGGAHSGQPLHLALVFLFEHEFFQSLAVFFLPPQEARHGPREGGEGGGEATGGGEGGAGDGGRHLVQPKQAAFLQETAVSLADLNLQVLALPHFRVGGRAGGGGVVHAVHSLHLGFPHILRMSV
jgi:hypothetical protein